MGQRIVVVGAGGMGREAAAWVADAFADAEVVGFVDEDPATHGTTVADLPVLGGPDWISEHGDVQAVVAVGSPRARADVSSRLLAADVPLATVIHPTVVVGPRTRIGTGAIVCPGVILTCDVAVGAGTIVNYGALVGHDTQLGDACFIAPGAHLAGNVTVGARADIGIGASVIQGITIGDDAIVGAGAAVIRDVPAGTTVVGVPARPIRTEPR